MAIKHQNPKHKTRTARAPYNFIPVPDRVIAFSTEKKNPLVVDQDQYHTRRYTGWIDLTITTMSPVFIRAGLTPEDYAKMEQEDNDSRLPHLNRIKNRPEFYYTQDPNQPVIPGSSLRGMFRQLSQIVSFGKLQPVKDKPEIYRAVGDTSSHGDAYRDALMQEGDDRAGRNAYIPKMKGGFMRWHNGRWYIQPAREFDGATHGRINHKRIPRNLEKWSKCKNASIVYLKPSPNDYKKIRGGFINIKRPHAIDANATPQANLVKAVIARTGQMNKKSSEAYIYAPETAEFDDSWIPVPDGIWNDDDTDLIQDYKDQMSVEQGKLLGSAGVLQAGHPVFYLLKSDQSSAEEKLVFFGHGPLFRLPYQRSAKELLGKVHDNDKTLDFTEAIFGRASGQSEARAGRVFFEDAEMQSFPSDLSNPWMPNQQTFIAKILNSPKPTTFQHYLVQTNPDVDRGKGLHTYNAPKKTTVRGFKMYWHKGDAEPSSFEEQEPIDRQKDKVHTQIKPVRSSVVFKGRVRFENLLPIELGILLYVTQLSDKEGYCHKIGMGKPLGLGAIQVQPQLNLIDVATRYDSLFGDGVGQFDTGERQLDAQAATEEAVGNFEKFMLKNSGSDAKQFSDIPRIKMLKKMLEFPGPDKGLTRYMEIERRDPNARRGKTNEYRDRPVLPDPLNVDRSKR